MAVRLVRTSALPAPGQKLYRARAKSRTATPCVASAKPRRRSAGTYRYARRHGLVLAALSLARDCHGRGWSLGTAGHPLLLGWRRRCQREPGCLRGDAGPVTSAGLAARRPRPGLTKEIPPGGNQARGVGDLTRQIRLYDTHHHAARPFLLCPEASPSPTQMADADVLLLRAEGL